MVFHLEGTEAEKKKELLSISGKRARKEMRKGGENDGKNHVVWKKKNKVSLPGVMHGMGRGRGCIHRKRKRGEEGVSVERH